MTDQRQRKESPFAWVPSSDYGTSNWIVARTYYQSQQLLNLYSFDKEFEKLRSEVMMAIQRRLLDCYKISSSLIEEINNNNILFKEKAKSDPSFYPYIMDLDKKIESFFQSAKLGLRDIGGIIKLFFGENFNHKYHKALEWAEKEFGKDDNLTKTLNRHSEWIAEIVVMRNAIEHPSDKPRGRLYVKDFCVQRSNSKVKLREPSWHLTDEPPYIVSTVLPAIVEQLLQLSEELYVNSLKKQPNLIDVKIEEIPEEQRDKNAPVRFRAINF